MHIQEENQFDDEGLIGKTRWKFCLTVNEMARMSAKLIATKVVILDVLMCTETLLCPLNDDFNSMVTLWIVIGP
jgi:hypothetical protein